MSRALADGDSLASIAAKKEYRTIAACAVGREATATLGLSTQWLDAPVNERRAGELLEITDDLSADWIETEDGGAALRSRYTGPSRRDK
jgi:hypothetical protein